MNKYTLIFLGFVANLYSQHMVLDSVFQYEIPRVEIYSSKGDLIGLSDKNGVVNQDIIGKIKNTSSLDIILLHPSYKTKIVNKSEILSGSIKLSPIFVTLEEVTLVGKKDYKFLKIETYFRSIQINNNMPHYYIEGLADYYISLKSKKIKVDITQCRSFENKQIKQLDTQGKVQVSFLLAGAPYLNDYIDFKNIEHEFVFEESNNQINLIAKGDSLAVGVIKISEKRTCFDLSMIPDSKPIKRSGFGNETIQKTDNVSVIYQNCNKIEDINIENLQFYKELRTYDLKNKSDKQYQSVEVTHEVFVLNKDYTNTINKKFLNGFYIFESNNNFDNEFWKEVKNPYYQELPKSIMSVLEK